MSKSTESHSRHQPNVEYIAPFSVLEPVMAVGKRPDGQVGVEMPLEVFAKIFELALKQIGFDEAGYLEKNPDVSRALGKGEIQSAIGHFARSGYFENRQASRPAADTNWYVKEYPDVARAVQEGKVKSANEHWERNGYFEGRSPSLGFREEVERWRALTTAGILE